MSDDYGPTDNGPVTVSVPLDALRALVVRLREGQEQRVEFSRDNCVMAAKAAELSGNVCREVADELWKYVRD